MSQRGDSSIRLRAGEGAVRGGERECGERERRDGKKVTE